MAEKKSLWNTEIMAQALLDSVRKLDPRWMVKNPVMFVVEVGSVLTTALLIDNTVHHRAGFGFNLQITLWLWFTVLFANFAEAMAEGRGKAQADTLRKAKGETIAKRYTADGSFEEVASGLLRLGDVIYVEAGHYIAGDGEVIEGVASVDESAITGESAPVIREAGGDRSAVTGGTKVLSDWIKVRITSNPGETFLDRMIALVEGATRQKTPNEIALSILLSGLTIVFLLAVVTLQPFAMYSKAPQTVFVLVSLLVCLIPTTIGGLLSAIGIAGMDRLVQYNVLAMSGRAVEAAGDVNTLLLDKTGTITLGNRQATEFIPAPDVSHERLANAAQLASLSDETPEGRSIVVLAKEKYNLRGRDLAGIHAEFVPFTAQTRMSGVNLPGTRIRKGSVDAIARFLEEQGSSLPQKVREHVEEIARARRHAAGGGRKRHGPGRHLPQGHRQGRPQGAPGPPARHGHPHHHDHRRQPADRRRHRPRGRRGRLPGRGQAQGQDGPDQARAGQGQAGGHDRRRHQRRARAGPGRRGRGHELRHAGRQGSRQHGRSRLQPHQADRDRRDRQAAADDARRADHLLHRQRRGQVLRHHSRHVRRRLSGARTRSTSCICTRRSRPFSRRSSSTPSLSWR